MEIVDAQLHGNMYATTDVAVASMNAAGVSAAIYDEFGGYTPEGKRLPSVELSNGAWRVVQSYAEAAIKAHPDRFARSGRIDRNDPELDWVMSRIKSVPDRICIRVTAPQAAPETKALFSGQYMDYFAAAQKHRVPCFVLTWGQPEILAQYAEKFPDLQFIIDHCGVERANFKGNFDETIKMARFKNVALKWCHAPELSKEGYPFRDIMPHFLKVVEAYTPQRIMWGSDATMHPVCSYAETYFYIRDSEKLSDGDKEWILGRTCRTLLNWKKMEKAKA